MDDKLQILVVDDNLSSVESLKDVLGLIDGVKLSETTETLRTANAKLKQIPMDIVFLNIDMPKQDSLEFLRQIKTSFPDMEIIAMGEPAATNTQSVVKALEMGALEYIAKPVAGYGQKGVRELRLRLLTIFGRVQNRKNLRGAGSHAPQRPVVSEAFLKISEPVQPNQAREETGPAVDRSNQNGTVLGLQGKVDVVAIAASTGGPNALIEVISKLPEDLGVPILLVQHMPPNLTRSLAESLNAKTKQIVREAVADEPVLPNLVYLAPGGKHMVVYNKTAGTGSAQTVTIGLNDNPPVNSVRPSADVLFRSIAQAYQENILAVIMTGMGADGKLGVAAMKQKKCYCLTQSEATCVIYGMPRAVVEADLSDEKVDLDQLAGRIVAIVKGTERIRKP